MKYIINLENELWNEWKEKSPDLIIDGMVSPEHYLATDVKIMFLLKEVNGGSGWDLRAFLRDGGRAQSWDNIARWVEGIRRVNEEIHWSELELNTETRRKQYLPEICAVNIKKFSGGHTSDRKSISEAAKENAEFLRRQISIYKPDLLICCGTGNYYYDNIMQYEGDRPAWEQTNRGIWFVREAERIMISYLHPAARVKDCVLYYGLIDAVKEILHSGDEAEESAGGQIRHKIN